MWRRASALSARSDYRLYVRIGRRARANEVPVPIRALNSRHRWPDLEVQSPRRRECGTLPRIRMRPRARRHAPDRVRRVLEDVVLLVRFAGLDLPDLLANRDHRLAESVELLFRLAFRRLDHQRSGHRKRDRRRVEAVVHQPFRDVLDLDAARLLHHPRVDDALVRDGSVRALVQQRKVRLETLRDVVRVEDRDLGRVFQSISAHQLDVGVRNRENAGTSPRRRRYRSDLVPSVQSDHRFARQNVTRCFATPMGPIPGPPPPCGMQNVLWRLRWQTSAPMSAGRHKPTIAFMFAPSMYTCPPYLWTMSQISTIDSSNTPWVEGYVTISAARCNPCSSAFAFTSATSMFPRSSVFTTTTCMPAITALAGFVPCAD